MRPESRILFGASSASARSFDVICAGEALWSVDESAAMQFRPGGGAVNAARALARQGLSVGLATVIADDTFGRALVARIAADGVDVGGVELAHSSSGLVLVEGGGGSRQVVSFREEEQPVTVPDGWSSQVLLLSGMSPVLSHGAALCKAARAARRAGTCVVVDINARWHLWKGRDPRAIRMILREADVVWCSAEDLLGLNMDVEAVRASMRPNAVLAMIDGEGSAWATGPFGEIAKAPEGGRARGPLIEGDAFTAAICAEIARAGNPGEQSGELWARALERGYASVRRQLVNRR